MNTLRTTRVILNKTLNFSESQFPYLKNGANRVRIVTVKTRQSARTEPASLWVSAVGAAETERPRMCLGGDACLAGGLMGWEGSTAFLGRGVCLSSHPDHGCHSPVSGGRHVPLCGQKQPRSESAGRPAGDCPGGPGQEGEPGMEPRGGGRTEGICAFLLPGQGPEPGSLGLESALLGCPPWSPSCQGMRRIRGWDPRREEKKEKAGWRGEQASVG